MDTIFSLNDNVDETIENVDIDELYEREMKRSKEVLRLYNNILKRIHTKIRNTSRASKEQHIWYLLPEVIVGVHYYNQRKCLEFIMEKLLSNGFRATYTHPNLIFVSWNNWVPDYVRNEWCKKTGKKIDSSGEEIKQPAKNPLEFIHTPKSNGTSAQKSTIYKDITTYIPTGKFI